MPYIPQIKIGNVTYDVKDTTARNDISDLKSAMNDINADVADLKLDVKGEYSLEWIVNEYVVTADGSFAHYNGWKRTKYVDVDGAKEIVITNSGSPNNNNAWYDENKGFVAAFRNGSGTLAVPANAKYFIISAENSAEFTITKSDSNLFEIVEQKIANKPSIIFDRVPIFQKDYDWYEYTAGTQGWFEKLLTSIQVTGGNNYGIMLDYHEGFPHENEYVIYIYGKDANGTTIERRTLSRTTGNSIVFTANAYTVTYDIYMEIDRDSGISETGKAKIYGFKLYDLGSAKKLVIDDFFAIKSDNIIGNALPDYYDSYLKNKIATIRNYDDAIGTTGDRFIFITDYHDYSIGNSNYSPALIKEIIKNVPISMTVFGGDGVNSADTEAEMKDRLMGFLQRFDGIENFYPIIGNHEFYSDWLNPGDYKGGITKSEVYAYFNKRLERDADAVDGISGFRIDNPVAKIRYYMLGCDYNVGIDTETKKWCFNDLLTTPDDYIVVFMAHYALNANASPAVLSDAFTDVHNAIVAAKNSSTFTFDGITFDYTSLNVTIPLVIGGHAHIDASALIDGVNYVSVTADNSHSALTESDVDDRTLGTVDEQAFDVVSIDRSSKKAYFTRIGGGHDREFSYA